MKFVVRSLQFVVAVVVVSTVTPPLPAAPPSLDLNALASRTRPAVAALKVTRTKSTKTCTGTGFFVSKDGQLITNWHVIRDAATIAVATAGGETLTARVVAEDPEHDVALLQIDGHEFPALELASSDLAEAGVPIVLVGNSQFREERGLRGGIVAAVQRIFGRTMIQISTPLQPGLSGSPLVNAAGEVIGVANGQFVGATEEENVNFAVPLAPVRKLLARMLPAPAATPAPSLAIAPDPVKLVIAE
jgi:S1-C subfamily serine protease